MTNTSAPSPGDIPGFSVNQAGDPTEAMNYTIFMVDKEGIIRTWSNESRLLTGYTASEITGKHISKLYSNSDLDQTVISKILEITGRKGSVESKLCLKRKDGSTLLAAIKYMARYDCANHLAGFLVMANWIPGQKLANYCIKDPAEEIAIAHGQFFVNDKELSVTFDRNWNYIYISHYAAALNGRKPEDLIGKNLWLEFPKKRNCEFYKNLIKSVEENKQITIESYHPIWRKWFIATVSPSANGLTVHLQDVTAKKREAYKLYEEHEQYRQIVETAQEGIWLIDANNLTFFVNRKMGEILDYSYEEMIGKENTFFMTDTSKEKALSALERRKKGLVENLELQLITKKGKLICTNLSANPIFDDSGVYKGALAMVTDITDKKLLQQQLLKEQENRQREITRAVENAHEKERSEIGAELHDNVQQLLVASTLFINQGILKEEFKKELIEQGLNYLTTAIEELRKLSHALVGPPNDHMIGLFETVRELADSVSIVQNIQIDFRYVNVKEHDIEPEVKLVIYRIIQEQLNNIIKHAFATKVLIEIKKENEALILIVDDNGVGFDTFAKRKGIGLKSIKNRAGVYNGKMSLNSSPGKGVNLKIVFKLTT
jgi:PAS domain S-box-containing protein